MRACLEINKTPSVTISDRFLSVAIDLSQVVGRDWWAPEVKRTLSITGHDNPDPFDFERSKLIVMAQSLSPAYLRFSGTKCDELLYFETLSRSQWDKMNAFATKCGFDIIFGLNAGLHVRDAKKEWTIQNAERIIEYTQKQQYPVKVWELGNEVNAFLLRGLRWRVAPRQYASDFCRANRLVKSYSEEYRLAGPSSAFVPIICEPFPVTKFFLKNRKNNVDIVSWHYYPQQSRRCPFATRRAKPWTLLNPDNLDEINKWAAHIENLRNSVNVL